MKRILHLILLLTNLTTLYADQKRDMMLPDLSIKLISGKQARLSSLLEDGPILVNFWATWCAPCIKEMPSLDRLKYKVGNNFDVIAISVDRDGINKVKDFFDNNNIKNLEKFFDIKNSLAKEMNLFGVPTSFFIDKNGNIIGNYQGDMEWDNLTVIEFIKYLIKI